MSAYRIGAVMMPTRMKVGSVKLVREIRASVMVKMKAVGAHGVTLTEIVDTVDNNTGAIVDPIQ